MRMLIIGLLAASLLFFGCVQEPASTASQNNTAFEQLRGDYANVLVERDALKESLGQTKNELTAASTQAQAEQSALEALKQQQTLVLNEIKSALYNATTADTASRETSIRSYQNLDAIGCRYYFLTGGYYTGGNLTIPIQCALYVSDYLDQSYAYIKAAGNSTSQVQAVLNKYSS